MNELQRLCVEEIKKETRYPTNKRASNLDPSLNIHDPKNQSADTQINHYSQVELGANHDEIRPRSKSRGKEVVRVGLNPNITSRIIKFVQK